MRCPVAREEGTAHVHIPVVGEPYARAILQYESGDIERFRRDVSEPCAPELTTADGVP